jgi:hypothetical protein
MYDSLKRQIIGRAAGKFISIGALEKKAGLKRNVLRNILKGASKNPSISILLATASALECSILDLLEKNVAPEPKNISNHYNKDLLRDVFDTVLEVSEKKKIPLSSQDIFTILKEVYYYSINKNESKADKSFSEWFITEHIKKFNKQLPSRQEKSNILEEVE